MSSTSFHSGLNLNLMGDAMVWHYRDSVFLTDVPVASRLDAVFPLSRESAFLADQLTLTAGARVLDLGTGCGFLAVLAAKMSSHVVATDINPRALDFARLNAALNDVGASIDFRLGDWFEPVDHERFDLIISNPPFEPVPEGTRYFCHSDGGPVGTNSLEKVLAEVGDYLRPGGVFQGIAYVCADGWDLVRDRVARFPGAMLKEVWNVDDDQYVNRIQRHLAALNPSRGAPAVSPRLTGWRCIHIGLSAPGGSGPVS